MIIEINGRCAVVADDIGHDGNTLDQFPAKGDRVVGDKRGPSEQQHNAVRQHESAFVCGGAKGRENLT